MVSHLTRSWNPVVSDVTRSWTPGGRGRERGYLRAPPQAETGLAGSARRVLCNFPVRERLQAHSSAAGTDAATRPTTPLRCCRRQPAPEVRRWAAAGELGRISLRVALALSSWSYGTQDPLVGLRSRDGRRAPSRRFLCRRSSSTASGPPCAVSGLAVGRWSGLPVGAPGPDPRALRATRVSDEDSPG